MTTIQPSLIPVYPSGVSSVSQVSGDQLLLDQLDSQQNQNTANNVFGGAYSLDLSDAALNAIGGNGSAGSDPTAGILNALTYSNFSGNSQEASSMDALLGSLQNIGSGSANPLDFAAPIVPSSLDGSSFAEATLADGGPLPAFLAYVDVQMHLSATQQQSLQNIASENMDVNYTPAAIQQIATELQQAGIPETI